MQDKEILKIIRVVVEYNWPWQYDDWQSPFVTAEDQSIGHLLHCFYLQECKPGRDDVHVRLDPTHVWNWPIETREGMPVWQRSRSGALTGLLGPWFPWKKTYTDMVSMGLDTIIYQVVAPNPLNPDEPPPADWQPEGRRVLE